MFTMLSVALAPAIALLIFIYQKDRYDREPVGLLAKLFIYGVLSVIPVYFIERFISGLGSRENAFFQAFIVAGLTEELFKLLIVRNVAFNSRFYNEKLDGIIYCVFASMGFASAENVLYVFNMSSNYMYTGISRALLAVPAHMLFAITMGYYLSLAKYARLKSQSNTFMFEALFLPVILHGTYDYIIFSKVYGFFIILIIFVIYLWRVNLKRLDRYVRESRDIYEK